MSVDPVAVETCAEEDINGREGWVLAGEEPGYGGSRGRESIVARPVAQLADEWDSDDRPIAQDVQDPTVGRDCQVVRSIAEGKRLANLLTGSGPDGYEMVLTGHEVAVIGVAIGDQVKRPAIGREHHAMPIGRVVVKRHCLSRGKLDADDLVGKRSAGQVRVKDLAVRRQGKEVGRRTLRPAPRQLDGAPEAAGGGDHGNDPVI